MADIQKLKYDLAMNCAFIKALRSNATKDNKLLEIMTEGFKEFYRGCNEYSELNLAEALELMNQKE